jgi:hypothetical protein
MTAVNSSTPGPNFRTGENDRQVRNRNGDRVAAQFRCHDPQRQAHPVPPVVCRTVLRGYGSKHTLARTSHPVCEHGKCSPFVVCIANLSGVESENRAALSAAWGRSRRCRRVAVALYSGHGE